MDRTIAALLGGLAMVVLGVLDQEHAFGAIDLNVIFLLAGMMVLAGILAQTGFFEWLAIRSVRASHGHPMRLLIILAVVTAVVSAFLDNVTTVVLMTPVTLAVAARLGVSPVPYLISQILASNIGGTATLIGDPPNILIGSAAGLDFAAFLTNLAPVALLILLAFLGLMAIAFRGSLQVPDERREAALEAMEPAAIHDRRRLAVTLVVLGVALIGFVAHDALGLQVASIALLAAAVLMLLVKIDPHEAFREVEWSTLFFFVGLFMLVEGIVQVGLLDRVATAILDLTGGDDGASAMALLWFSALASAVVDNIPYTATAIPVVHRLVAEGVAPDALWWSLALGACLGGNLTIIGASANVVVSDIAGRAGHPIRFGQFMRYGAMTVAVSLAISSAYVWIRYVA